MERSVETAGVATPVERPADDFLIPKFVIAKMFSSRAELHCKEWVDLAWFTMIYLRNQCTINIH